MFGVQITPTAITAAFKAQTGINNAFNLRLISARAWGFDRLALVMVINDPEGKSRYKTLTDVGGAVSYSKVGWRFGEEFTSNSHLAAGTDVLFSIYGEEDSTGVLYMQVLVCSNQEVTPPISFLNGLKEGASEASCLTDIHGSVDGFEHMTMVG